MSTGHQCEAVGVVESLRDVLTESVASSSGGDAPATAVVGIWPQQVTHGTLRRTRRRSRFILVLNSDFPDSEAAYNSTLEKERHNFLLSLPHVALPVNGPVLWCDPMYLWTVTSLHEDRKSGRKRGMSINRTYKYFSLSINFCIQHYFDSKT